MADQAFQIGELSGRTGCNIETIRYYEKIGVVARPMRTEGGHRIYGLDHVRRLSFVRRARELGFTLDEVRALLNLSADGGAPCAEVRDLASSHLQDVRARIADLKRMERVLAASVRACNLGHDAGCPLIDALHGAPSPIAPPASHRERPRVKGPGR
jgi:MerR family mercuric resistance operon transcriptional regulator